MRPIQNSNVSQGIYAPNALRLIDRADHCADGLKTAFHGTAKGGQLPSSLLSALLSIRVQAMELVHFKGEQSTAVDDFFSRSDRFCHGLEQGLSLEQ